MDSTAAVPEEVAAPAVSLLDGEDPNSTHLEDPEHWVTVYSELFESTSRMLNAARQRLDSAGAADEADLGLVEREISALLVRAEFFSARMRWWAMRGRELWAESGKRA
jgi:hypothetical protein